MPQCQDGLVSRGGAIDSLRRRPRGSFSRSKSIETMSDALETTAPKNFIANSFKVWVRFFSHGLGVSFSFVPPAPSAQKNFLYLQYPLARRWSVPLAGYGVVAGLAAFWLIQPNKVMQHFPIIGKNFK